MTDDPITIEKVSCRLDTPKAILVLIDEREVWVPKSVIHDDSEVYTKNTEGDLIIERWWAEKEGIEP
jgi:hypothetical protein